MTYYQILKLLIIKKTFGLFNFPYLIFQQIMIIFCITINLLALIMNGIIRLEILT